MSKVNWWLVMAGTGIVALIVILFLLPIRLSSARDFGQWDRGDPLVQWYRTLSHPDISCFGEEDCYFTGFSCARDAKNSNALSIGFAYAAVRNLGDCDENQRRPSNAALG